MFRALGARLTLDHKGVAGAALFEAAAQRTWLWATSGLKTATDLLTEGELQENGLEVHVIRCDSDNRSLCRVAVQRPDEWDPSLLWLTTVDVVRTGDIGGYRRLGGAGPASPSRAAVATGATAGRAAPRLRQRGRDRRNATAARDTGGDHGERADRRLRAGVPPRPGAASPGRALQRDQGGGRRLPDRCRQSGPHRPRALRAGARLRHAARRGLASAHQAAGHALRVRRRGAHLLAATPAHRPAATPSRCTSASGSTPPAGRPSSVAWSRPARAPTGPRTAPQPCSRPAGASTRRSASRRSRTIPTRPARPPCCATSCFESSTPRWRSSTRWRRCDIS